jgi:hypothetical protein
MAVLWVPNGSVTFPSLLGYITAPQGDGVSSMFLLLLLFLSLLYFSILFWAVPITI